MLYLIQKCVYDHRPDAGFSRHDPSSVKKAVGTHANSGEKLDMKASIARLWPTLNTKVDLETLDQHAIDAIAVGYASYHKST
jgi:Holliday junction resolvasome RuvABC endonuclease subunit